MRQFFSFIRKINETRCCCESTKNYQKMEDVLKNIFYSAVDAVKPSSLICGNKFLLHKFSENREFIVINHDNKTYHFDITNKNIHIGKSNQMLWIYIIYCT